MSTTTSADRPDRFGTVHAAGLPYARGRILDSGQAEHLKLRRARALMREWVERNGPGGLFNLSGLERGMPLDTDMVYDDEVSPALFEQELSKLALDHLGGRADKHDTLLLNRQSAALFAAIMVLVERGETVVGLSPTYTHPAVTRPVSLLGGNFVDAAGLEELERVLSTAEVSLIVLTRLAVSYDLLSIADVVRATELARHFGVPILVDDAGGARVGPAVFHQPRLLELDIDVGSTGLDKYGTIGPRLGLLGGRWDLVAEIRNRAFEYGLEARPMLYPAVIRSLSQYREERVRDLAACTATLAVALRETLGDAVQSTPVCVKLPAEELLAMAMERSGASTALIVPYEATAATAMLLLRDYGVISVHFAGLPPGTSALLFKFMRPETLDRFGGPQKLARAIDSCIDQLSELIGDPDALRALLLDSSGR